MVFVFMLILSFATKRWASPNCCKNDIFDSNTTNDNTAKVTNSNLKTIIDNKLAELNLSGYSAKMIMNRAAFSASNLPIQLIEQVKIVQSMLRIERLAH
jgi:hypothetical protein